MTDKHVVEEVDFEQEFEIDDVLAQALTSAVVSRAQGGARHAHFILANMVVYVNLVTDGDVDNFLKTLAHVEENNPASKMKVTASEYRVGEPDEEDTDEVSPEKSKLN